MKVAVVTGSSGLIGSQCVKTFSKTHDKVIGLDNNMRKYFFGEDASTEEIKNHLVEKYENFTSYDIDIRDRIALKRLFACDKDLAHTDIIVHAAAQPSHDWAAKEPFTDFDVNATGTINMLETYKMYCPDASFIFTSTNKVYGDNPNKLDISELETRYDHESDIDESMSIDNCKHSIFGASKVAADIMVQEYGKYFGLNTVSFRCGCLTGENHMGAELHGFLSYLIKCMIHNKPYTIFGYKGKQVRDNIHSEDLVNAFLAYHKKPKSGEVYNMGGGRENSISILEAINKVNQITGKNWSNFNVSETAREGDHIWYISDLSKFKKDFPKWKIKNNIDSTIKKMIKGESK